MRNHKLVQQFKEKLDEYSKDHTLYNPFPDDNNEMKLTSYEWRQISDMTEYNSREITANIIHRISEGKSNKFFDRDYIIPLDQFEPLYDLIEEARLNAWNAQKQNHSPSIEQ